MLTLIRGLPGSGKSTLAKRLANSSNAHHVETDMYFVDVQGRYHFQPEQLSVAHQWCKTQVFDRLKSSQSVIVSNTFVEAWELDDYLKMAHKLDIDVHIIECKEQYQSIHDVPSKTIAKMRRNWANLSINQLKKRYHLATVSVSNSQDL